MSDDSALDQSEIERLLGGGKPAAPKPAEKPAAPAPAAPDDSGVLSQSELDALFGGGSSAPAAPTAPPAAAPAPATPNQDGTLNQSDLDALFGKTSTPAAPAPAVPAKPAAAKPAAVSPAAASPAAAKPAAAKPASPAPQTHAAAMAPPAVTPLHFGSPASNVQEVEQDDENYDGVPHGDIDYILNKSEDTLRSVASSNLNLPAEVIEFQFPEFGGTVPSTEHTTLDQISEVELDVKIELGRTNMYLEDILKLRRGSVVPLDKMAGEAVDIYINGRLLARGEVLVMNENFCVRVAELLAGAIPME
jgi:flagellar motor switch protein FliN/FliY